MVNSLASVFRVAIIFFSTQAQASSTSLDTKIHSKKKHKISNQCRLYLASSSLPGAGVGVFAGKDYKYGDRIGEPGQGIQIIDPSRIISEEEFITEFSWNSIAVGGDSEADEVFTLLPGPGMLVNFHPSLSNILAGGLKEGSNLRRNMDPGAGASTSYNNFTFIATTNITAGQELFAPTGKSWYSHYENLIGGEGIAFKDDYEFVDKLVLALSKFIEDHPELSEAQILDILYRTKNEILQQHKRSKLIFPVTMKGFLDASFKGTARARLKEHSIEWLRENGQCLDNIRANISKIPGSGLGGFAKRFIAKGNVISPSPLVQVLNKKNFELSRGRKQLMMNYCFGHRLSSLLLCPATSVSLINHGGKESNAVLRWSESSTDILTRTLDELSPTAGNAPEYNIVLSFDFVAKRDIHINEEITLDYGKDWEDAWNKHVSKWTEKEKNDSYMPSNVLNENNSQIMLSSNPQMARYSYSCRLEAFAREEDVDNIPEEDFNANPAILPESWNEELRLMYGENDFLWWWPCKVTEINEDGTLFKTEVFKKSKDGRSHSSIIRRFRNVPRNAIKFVNRHYSSDQHMTESFRHYITIPDDIFPLHWRNDYTTAKSVGLGQSNHGIDVNDKKNELLLEIYEQDLGKAKCGVYIAPSTIPNGGIGTFIGVTTPGKDISLGSKVPIIPVMNMKYNDATYDDEQWDAEDYAWSASAFDVEFEGDDSLSVLAVNEGAMANFHPGLVNYESSSTVYNPILDRCKDPGAGAFSDFVDFSFKSLRRVNAGEEVFISYGDEWFEDRDHLGNVPLHSHYEEANEIVASLSAFQSLGSGLDDRVFTDHLNLVKENAVKNGKTQEVLASVNQLGDFKEILSKNGTAQTTVEARTIDWLEQHGSCIDHIYSKRSTIKQAGMGAFARRFIPKGNVVIPVPLLNTWGRDTFDIVLKPHLPKDVNRKLLLYNYQFGHPDSSLLFFPTNTAIAINHQSTRSKNGKSPNAKLQWSKTNKKSLYFLQRHLEDLKREHYATIIIDVVATDDIFVGEEIFIDYGEAWEEAWNEHVKNFKSPCHPQHCRTPCFKSSKIVHSMNNDKFNEKYHEWSDDHFTVCATKESSVSDTNSEIVAQLTPETAGEGEEGEMRSWNNITYGHEGFDLASRSETWTPCQILGYEKNGGTFDVILFTTRNRNGGKKMMDRDEHLLERRRSLLANDVKFINKPYKSDMHAPSAFRKEIMIPDEIFPPLWKDLL